MAWDTQHDDDDTKVQVSGDYARNGERTDFLIIDKSAGTHSHSSIGSGADDDLIEHHGQEK